MDNRDLKKKIDAYYDNFSDDEFKNKLINAGFEILDDQPGALIIEEIEVIEEFYLPKPIIGKGKQSYSIEAEELNVWKATNHTSRNVG